MASGVTVAYNGNVIHQMPSNGTFKMNTANAYMEGDIDVVVDVEGGGGVSVENNEPYNLRPISDVGIERGNRERGKIVGGTVNWNQLVQNGTFVTTNNWSSTAYAVFSVSDNIAHAEFTSNYNYIMQNITTVSGHTYLTLANIRAVQGIMNVNLDNSGSITISDTTWKTYGKIFKASGSSFMIAPLRRATSDGTVVGEAKNVNVFDLTAMFGSTIADYIYSLEQASAGDGVAWFRKYFPKDYYEYNSGSLESVNVSAHVMRDANDNIIGNYPLDSTLTLRGIPKLDADNNLVYDGDVYEYDGTVTRNYTIRAYQSGDESLADAITDGTNTVVKLVTPTTESADPYTYIQKMDVNGTEEFIDYAESQGTMDVAIPVGHETEYYQLDAKLVSKAITENGTYNASDDNADGYDEVTVNVSGGTPFRFDVGQFYGNIQGNTTTSLQCNYTVRSASKMLLIIMHRDDITLNDNEFTLIRKDRNANYEQYISIYQKTFNSATSGTVTITQASSARMCACSLFVDNNVNITGMATKDYDNPTIGVNGTITITPSASNRLVVFSHAWVNSSASGYSRDLQPSQLVLPENYINKAGAQARLVAFIANAYSDIVYAPHSSLDADTISNNQTNIYTLSH